MKNFLSTFLRFSIFALGFYFVILLLWGSFLPQMMKPNLNYKVGAYGHMFSRIEEVKTTSDIDILFMGSSHAYRGFDTRLFRQAGYTSFNLGSSSQSPMQTKLLLERYVEKLKPKLVVIEVYPGTFSSDGVESALDIIANDKIDFRTAKMAFDLNHVKVFNTFFYGCAADLLNLHASFKEPSRIGANTYITGGFVEKEVKYYDYKSYKGKKWKFNDDQFLAFEEIMDFLKDKGIQSLLVYAPLTSARHNGYFNNAEFDSIMTGYGNYHNFNQRVPLDDSLHFYDSHHLNQDGVEIFNSAFIDFLRKEKLLTQ